jgi:predicted nucleic acid-binding Zn ribbon protein
MFCPYCGAKIPDNQKFCIQCGKPLNGNPPSPQGNTRQKKSPVLAILLILTLLMTAVTAGYFLAYNGVINISGITPSENVASDVASSAVEEKEPVEAETVQPQVTETEPVSTDTDNEAQAQPAEDDKMQAAQEKVESEFDTVSSTPKTPQNIAEGGTREKLPSGEIICTLNDGSEARNIWVKNDDGKLYYFGYDGCMVRNNYAPDGFFAGDDGALDDSVSRINGSQGKPLLDKNFVSKTSSDPVVLFEKSPDSTYKYLFIRRYSFGYDETFGVMEDPDSSHSYLLDLEKNGNQSFDECKGALLTILDDGETLIVSDCGITETYYAK